MIIEMKEELPLNFSNELFFQGYHHYNFNKKRDSHTLFI